MEREQAFRMMEHDLNATNLSAANLFMLACRLATELNHSSYAVELYNKAADIQNPIEGGHPVAMLHLAIHYEQGIGTKQDYSKAFYWYNRIIQHPFPGMESVHPALVALSLYCKDGLGGVEQAMHGEIN
jgi:TPR repeat protein